MKSFNKIINLVIFIFSFYQYGYSQKNIPSPWDPTLEANSEKWKLKTHRKIFGNISQLEFGPFNTALFEKLDSPVHKRKTKEGAEFGLNLGYDARMETGHEVDLDITKKIITQKSKYYRMLLAGNADTTETLCSTISFTKEEKETVGGAALKTLLHGHYSSEENKSGIIGYSEITNGFILTTPDSAIWNFYFASGKGINNNSPNSVTSDTINASKYLTGFLKNNSDSINISPVISRSIMKFLGKYDTLYFEEGYELVNQKGEHLAAYQKMGPDKKSPYIWMRKDISDADRKAIASFLEVIIYRNQY
jgi:hypothetical protein